ncbi:hypothetical protein B9479_003154 [Cryptococcus floricola]|uniref:Uncharacterized protein n=1 Tax=Cryptococcus floricola TaxID=2591691 RepID=A0A5D3AZE3_9TREE|nr:hypothetical protein B9479_003154 [Cryptococcus floricola]
MTPNFFAYWTEATDTGLPSALHGTCKKDDRILVIIELQLPNVLKSVGDVATSGTGDEAPVDEGGENHDAGDEVVGNEVGEGDENGELVLRIGRLIAECEKENGLILALGKKNGQDGKLPDALFIVDDEGNVIPEMGHWAAGLSQLFEQLLVHKLDLVILTSCNVWIPFQRDPVDSALIRMGTPIYRQTPDDQLQPCQPDAGQLSPM